MTTIRKITIRKTPILETPVRSTTVRLATLGVAGLLAGAGVAGFGAAGPASAAGTLLSERFLAAAPPTAVNLPAGIEDLAAQVPQISCDPAARAGVLALSRWLAGTYPGAGFVTSQPCGTQTVPSEHADGRALDWKVSARLTAQKAQADAVLSWLFGTDSAGRPFANARRLGVMYIVWNNRIWASYDALAGWRPFSTCGAHPQPAFDTFCHRDSVHLSLSWAGALAHTSFWSKAVAAPDYGPCRPRDLNWAPAYSGRNGTPCPSYPAVTAAANASTTVATLVRFSGATVGPGDSGPVVTAVQRGLAVTADGSYGPITADAVVALQRRYALPPSGTLDAATWRALLSDRVGATPAGQITSPGRQAVVPTVNPLTKYLGTVLRYGSRGPAVLALQSRLAITTSGWFGPATRAKVVAFQVSKKLTSDGIVGRATWKALGA